MKIAAQRIGAALDGGYSIILLYGEDAGLVRSRAAKAVRSACGPQPSPFQLSTLLKEEHGRLVDEASSVPLDGTRRVVRVQDAGDGLVAALTKLSASRSSALVILEAGELTPRSKLRAAAEKHDGWAAIACYPEGAAAVIASIQQAAKAAGQSISADAVQYLAQELSGDTSRRQQELEKLTLYAAGGGPISLEDAMACCATEDELVPTDIFAAAMAGLVTDTDELLAAAEWGGATGPGLLAAFAGTLHRLLRLRLLMDTGLSGDAAGRALRPPLYPRQLEASLRMMRTWSAAALRNLLAAVSAADADCKRAATRDLTIASKVILDAARYAHRRA